MRKKLVEETLPEELLHSRSNLSKTLDYLNEPELTEAEREELRKKAIDCEICGLWCHPSDIVSSRNGEEICESCQDEEE